jgi:diguanylate cyclase (GGDEF)-like protein/PAS domain S-box-containing protein
MDAARLRGRNGFARPRGATTPEGRYRLLFDRNPQPMWVYDTRTLEFLAVNDAAIESYGYSRREFLSMTLRDIRPSDDVDAMEREVARREPKATGSEWRHVRRDGTVIDVLVFADEMPFEGRPGRLVVAVDITERTRAKSELERREAQQSAVAELGARALEETDVGELFDIAVAEVAKQLGVEFCDLSERTPDQEGFLLRAGVGWHPGLVRRAVSPCGSSFHPGFVWGSLGETIIEDFASETRFRPTQLQVDHGVSSGISVIVGRRGRPLALLSAYSAERHSFCEDDLNFLKSVANLLAVAIQRQDAEDRVRHQALHDPLTGLPNRTLLRERLDHAVKRGQRSHADAAVLFVDIDSFKLVNDVFGHEAGDELLLEVAARLESAVRPADMVARVGGDEFVLVCEDVGAEADAIKLAKRVLERFAEPVRLRDRDHRVTASVGVVLQPGADDPESLVRHADAAMYLAKERGGDRFELFDEEMRDRSVRWLETERDLREALDSGRLHNLYQPLVTTEGEIVGFEALVRWDRPGHGTVLPADFIGVAEQSGLIVPIGEQVLRTACEDAREWASGRGSELFVSVNLSPRQVGDPRLVETVKRILDETGLDPARLHLEITETALFDDGEAALDTLNRLKELGLRLVLDDFGTGYSSLAFVRHFPIDVLKIDRSFVETVDRNPDDTAIVSAVISMGHALGVDVVAEGVETPEHVRRLRALGCSFAQGFLFSHPVPAGRIEGLLAQR